MAAAGADNLASLHDVTRDSEFRCDWQILRDTILASIATSPDAFLAKEDELKAEPPAYWTRRLGSSAWAVVERGGQVLGIAAATSPGEVDDYTRGEKACFLESIWIDPEIRGKGASKRLVTYLIEQQRMVGIQKFYLWVFEHNTTAIGLYKRMGFEPTGRASKLIDPPVTEVQYLLALDSDGTSDYELSQCDTARGPDWQGTDLTCRLLSPCSA